MKHPVTIRSEPAEVLAALYEEAGHGLTDDEMSRTQEPLERLEVAPEAFQFRMQHDRSGEKERHLRRLVQALKRRDGYLDPMRLFAIDGHRIVLDGHCRLQAYLRADLKPSTAVPIRYFRGPFNEALTLPASANHKVKLALTQEERLEAAWQLVLFDENRGNYSLRDIEDATGTCKSTVGNMRKVLEKAEAFVFNPREESWKGVKRRRREKRDHDPEWANERAKGWASQLREQLGDKPNDTPQCFFDALEIGYPQLFPQRVVDYWSADPGVRDELATPEEDFEF